MVTQCAMLEDFGIFLVLADKVKAPPCFPNLKSIISCGIFLNPKVALCIPYRGARTHVSSEPKHIAGAAEA
jgi:hypothetical protein